MRKGKKANSNSAALKVGRVLSIPSVNSRSVHARLIEEDCANLPAGESNRVPTISENCIAIYVRAEVLLTRARAIESRLSGKGSSNGLEKPDVDGLPLSQVLHHVSSTLSVIDQSLDAIWRELGVGE